MKTAVITGGSSGIGKGAALGLAQKGFRVIIHGRDVDKLKAAVAEITRVSGNPNVEYIAADISLIKGMKDLSEEIRQKTSVIDVLILSTGVILPRYVLTADGIEKGFAVQYLSRFAITNYLLPELGRSTSARIVHVGAPKLWFANIYFDDINFKKGFSMLKAMGQEMFANHLHVQEFAKRNPASKMYINMINAGIVKTDITREMNIIVRSMIEIVGASAKTAANNAVYLASEVQPQFSGYFLPKPGKPEEKDKMNYDPVVAQQLWELSYRLIQ